MSQLLDSKLVGSPETGRWVVDILWDDDGILRKEHREFDSQRRAMGFCEYYGWPLPLAMWQDAVAAEPLSLPNKFEIQESA